MFIWSKLIPAADFDGWESRFAANPNWFAGFSAGGRRVRINVVCESRVAGAALRAAHGGSLRPLREPDWSKPPEPPRPLKIRDAFLLTAATAAGELAALRRQHPGREILSIPVEMAFGTGDHATTSTCLRLLVDAARRRPPGSWSAADLGTGTGVLAVAARKLGAREVFACDFDPFAVAAATRNAGRNGTDAIRVAKQDVLRWNPRTRGYDVVLANLFSTVLIEAWPVIARALAPRGDLIVSGILASQAWDVFTAAARHGLGFTKVTRKGKWVTALGGRFDDLTAET